MNSTQKWNYLEDKVRLLGLNLADGETVNGLKCPACSGGYNSDYAFSITRRGSELLGICFRAKCGFTCRISSLREATVSRVNNSDLAKEQRYKSLKDSLRIVNAELADKLHRRFPYLPRAYTRTLRQLDGVLYLPIRDSYGTIIGYLRRDFWSTKGKKAIAYLEPKAVLTSDFSACLSGSKGLSVPTVIVVEDQISAIMVNEYANVDVVALIGSHVSQELVEHLWADLGYRRILIALDEDATKKSLKLAQRYSLYGAESVMLQKDPKDMTPEEIQNVFLERLY